MSELSVVRDGNGTRLRDTHIGCSPLDGFVAYRQRLECPSCDTEKAAVESLDRSLSFLVKVHIPVPALLCLFRCSYGLQGNKPDFQVIVCAMRFISSLIECAGFALKSDCMAAASTSTVLITKRMASAVSFGHHVGRLHCSVSAVLYGCKWYFRETSVWQTSAGP